MNRRDARRLTTITSRNWVHAGNGVFDAAYARTGQTNRSGFDPDLFVAELADRLWPEFTWSILRNLEDFGRFGAGGWCNGQRLY